MCECWRGVVGSIIACLSAVISLGVRLCRVRRRIERLASG